MLRLLFTWWAKWRYVANKEIDAGMQEWSARVAEKNANLNAADIDQLTKDADAMDARIKAMADMEEKGYWECENGHEMPGPDSEQVAKGIAEGRTNMTAPCTCFDCKKTMNFIKRSEMSGQEQYESDKNRRDAEQMLAAKREEIEQRKKDLDGQTNTAKYFRGQAKSARDLADAIRNL